jgi:hypothetical protein
MEIVQKFPASAQIYIPIDSILEKYRLSHAFKNRRFLQVHRHKKRRQIYDLSAQQRPHSLVSLPFKTKALISPAETGLRVDTAADTHARSKVEGGISRQLEKNDRFIWSK